MQASRLKEMKPSFFRMGNGRPEHGYINGIII